jgi:sporulation protein YlmC with PRC-barrel domain
MSYSQIMPAKQPVRVSEIIGTDVENYEHENCGCIREVVINKTYGEVAYFVLSYPGHFGPDYEQKYFAVPFESFNTVEKGKGNFDYVLNVDEDFLKKAPGFPRMQFPDFADPRFITEHKDYYKGITLDIAV